LNRHTVIRWARHTILILVVSIALGEIVLRMVNQRFPSSIFYDDSYNRFRVKPGSMDMGFRINSHGFKDTEFGPKRDDCYRIIAPSDSFGFGMVPYDRNYLTLLEDQLDREGECVEVFNMGIPRTGPPDHLALLVNEGLGFDPDMVLLSFYIGNDFIETMESRDRRRSLIERSYVASLLRYAFFIRPRIEPDKVHNRRNYRDTKPTFDPETYLQIVGSRAMIFDPDWEGFPPALEAVARTIGRIASICGRRNIGLTVVFIPDEIQLDAGLQRDLAAADPRYGEDVLDYQLPNRMLGERLDELGIDTLDLLPAFQKAATTDRLYKPRDTHWNLAGNALAAKLIVKHLEDTRFETRITNR
jgi:hypothetical protein